MLIINAINNGNISISNNEMAWRLAKYRRNVMWPSGWRQRGA